MLLKEKTLFNKKECDDIISLSKINSQDWNSYNRKYNSHAINYCESNRWVFERLNDFFEMETNLKIIKMKKQIHLHKFVKGDWFGKHNDIRDGRLYVMGVLLNNNFEGGDFKLYNTFEYTLNKHIGNTYIFDVKIEHEITPILKGERYSLLWFLQKEHIKIETNKLI